MPTSVTNRSKDLGARSSTANDPRWSFRMFHEFSISAMALCSDESASRDGLTLVS